MSPPGNHRETGDASSCLSARRILFSSEQGLLLLVGSSQPRSKIMKVIFAASIAALAFSAAALAQEANAVTTPQEFAAMAAGSNMFEIESSKLALQKASLQPTKDFAQHMIDDHTKAGEEMRAAATAE